MHGFFTNILGKGSEVSSRHLEVPALALIVSNVPPFLHLQMGTPESRRNEQWAAKVIGGVHSARTW